MEAAMSRADESVVVLGGVLFSLLLLLLPLKLLLLLPLLLLVALLLRPEAAGGVGPSSLPIRASRDVAPPACDEIMHESYHVRDV
jgi:hypothetical protein